MTTLAFDASADPILERRRRIQSVASASLKRRKNYSRIAVGLCWVALGIAIVPLVAVVVYVVIKGLPAWSVDFFTKVTVPQIVPGIAAGCLFSFMVSFDEFPISFWLANAETMPLPIFLQNSMTKIFDPSIAAMASLMILTGILAVIGLEKLVGLRRAMSI